MKAIQLAYNSRLDNIEISDIADLFERYFTFEYLDMFKWPVEFPYKPDCQVEIARSVDS